jgi:hypothetical protein
MALIQETLYDDLSGISLEVIKHTDDEMYDPWHIINFDSLGFGTGDFSAKELKSLGKWLIEQSKYISKNYTSKGNKKKGIV